VVRAGTAAAVAAAVAVAGLATAASAHVTVNADDAHQGASDSVLTFRVPDEDATASTVKLAISFPKQTPLASVRPAAKPGWTFTTTKTTFNPPIKTDDGTITAGISQVVYTASSPSAGIPAGAFDTFQILVGPLPDGVTSLAFPTVQTYSSGRSASWIQPVTDPASEPDSPAPILNLQPAAGQDAKASPPVRPSGADVPTMSEVTSARTLGLAGVVLGALGLIAAAGAGVIATRRRAG
jgi:uncharacterized protein YcnI